MTNQIKILLLTFVITIALIYSAPNAESAMIFITAFWGFIYLNNALYDYDNRATQEKNKLKESTSAHPPMGEQFRTNLVGEPNESNLDNFHIAPEFYDENFAPQKGSSSEKLESIINLDDSDNKSLPTNKEPINEKEDTSKYYDPDLEYTPDKIGYMRHDMENRTHQNETYTRCYKPPKGETNDCDLYEYMPIDERMSEYWRTIGQRGKKVADGQASKSADYFRAHFNTEFEREEKKVWWETDTAY